MDLRNYFTAKPKPKPAATAAAAAAPEEVCVLTIDALEGGRGLVSL
jgi:hypothetical protein